VLGSDAPAAGIAHLPPPAEFAPAASPAAPVGVDTGDKPSVFGQIVRGAAEGVSSAVDPSGALGLLSKDHYTRERGLIELTSEALANLATGRGIATGLGAAAGTVFAPGPGTAGGALVGNLLYGLYAGVGNEVSRSAAEGQEFSPLRAAGQVALEANPLLGADTKLIKALGLGSKLGTVGRAVGQAVGQGGLEYSYSNDAARAATVGTIGLLLAYPTYRGMRAVAPKTLPTDDTMAAVQRALGSDVGTDILERTEAKLAKSAAKLDTTDSDFRRFVTGATGASEATVGEQFDKLAGKMQPEQLENQWKLYQWSKSLQESAGEVVQDLTAKLGGKVDAADLRLRDLAYLKDAKFVGSAIDRKTGLNVEGLFDSFAKAKEAFQVKAAGYMSEATDVDAAARKLGLTRTDIGKALGGRMSDLRPEVQAKLQAPTLNDRDGRGKISVLDAWRRLFDNVRNEIRANGYDVGHLDNYVPLKELRGVDLAEALRDRLTDLQRKALAGGKRTLLDLGNDAEFQEFRDVVGRLLKKDPASLTDGDLVSAAKSALGRGKTSLGYSPGAVFERRGEGVPEFTREWDVGKLFTQYVNGNLKAVQFDEAFKRGQATLGALREMGLNKAGDYVERYLGDQSGAPTRGLAGAIRSTGETLRDAGRQLQAKGGVQGQVGKVLEAVPDIAGWANGLVYPSYLGLPNLRAPLRNMTQTFMTTAPELGVQGGKWVLGAWKDVIGDMLQAGKAGRNPFTEMEAQLQKAGLLGQHIMADIDTSPGLSSNLRHYVDKFNAAAMALYAQTDTMNRAVTQRVGQRWAAAVAAGDPAPIKAL
jgi:hypothetical protein